MRNTPALLEQTNRDPQRLMVCGWYVALTVALLAFMLGGCASTWTAAMSTEVMGNHANSAPAKPYVYLQLGPDSLSHFRGAAEKTTKESPLFRGFTFDEADAPRAEYTVKMDFRRNELPLLDAEQIWGFTMVILGNAIPVTCAKREYTLNAHVLDHAGNRIKSYELRESERSWVWLFQGENCNRESTPAVVEKISTKMIQTLYHKVSEDEILKHSGLLRPEESHEPLVYLSASRARSIAERVTMVDAPFPRFTFDEALAPEANFSIHLDFKSGIENQSMGKIIGRGMLSIMTTGIFSLCPSSLITLNARVIDRDKIEIKRYSLSDTAYTPANDACSPQDDENTRPDLYAGLIRALYDQFSRDRILNVSR